MAGMARHGDRRRRRVRHPRRARAARGRLRRPGDADRRRAAPALRAPAALQGRDRRRGAGAEGDRRRRAARRGRHRLPPRRRAATAIDRAARARALRRRRRRSPTTGCCSPPARGRGRCRCPAPTARPPRCCARSTTPPASAPRSARAGGSRSIGGGFIGLELAASRPQARRRGRRSSRRCRGCSPAACRPRSPRVLQARHVAEGVSFHFGARIAAITAARRRAVATARTIPADLVVVGIGAVPEHRARRRGRARHRQRHRRRRDASPPPTRRSSPPATAARSRMPLYDGRRVRLESWRSAQEQGALAARNMLGADEPVSAVPWFWSDQYDLDAADRRPRRRRRRRRSAASCGDGAFVLFHLAADGRLLAAQRHRPRQRGRQGHPPRRDDDRPAARTPTRPRSPRRRPT